MYETDDVNNATIIGTIYSIAVNENVQNCPPETGVTIYVLKGNWGITQIATHFKNNNIYIRAKFGGTWNDWRKI